MVKTKREREEIFKGEEKKQEKRKYVVSFDSELLELGQLLLCKEHPYKDIRNQILPKSPCQSHE